jgi:hypothetical protein
MSFRADSQSAFLLFLIQFAMSKTIISVLTENVPGRLEAQDPVLLEAQARLDSCPHRELRSLECELVDRTLYLRGHVRSFYMKQIAQECLRTIRNVSRIVNLIDVVDSVACD